MAEQGTTSPPRPIVILGPTAGGKSELAVMLAERLPAGGEVIGADSMQIYRRLDAGTAKPTPIQRARAPHHLIDIVEPTERYTVADWLLRADAIIVELRSRGVTPIVVGGTNLYIKALLEGMFEGPAIDEALRERLNATDLRELRTRLEAVDPQAAARIHPNDRKRTVRALEVFEQTGHRISELQTQWEEEGPRSEGQGERHEGTKARKHEGEGLEEAESLGPGPLALGPSSAYRHDPMLIGLAWPAEAINRRINLRVKAMFFPQSVEPAIAAEVTPTGESLIDETRRLQELGVLGLQAGKALGYQQVLDALSGRCTMDEAFERTKILTRRFAKTQRTWLKRFRGAHWIAAENKSREEIAEEALRAIAGE